MSKNPRLNRSLFLRFIDPSDRAIDWEKSGCTREELVKSQSVQNKLVFHEGQEPVVLIARYNTDTQRLYAEGKAGLTYDDKGKALYPVEEGIDESVVKVIVINKKANCLARCCVVAIEGIDGLPEKIHNRSILVGDVLKDEVAELLEERVPEILTTLGVEIEYGARLGEPKSSDSEAGASGDTSKAKTPTTPVESAEAKTSKTSLPKSETPPLSDDEKSGVVTETPNPTPKQETV